MKKHSFTLAEVLITIVVIGIIAAITVPVLMTNHKRTETTARLKKFYSNMNNALKQMEIEEGASLVELIESDTIDIYSFFPKYGEKYFNFMDSDGYTLGSTKRVEKYYLNDGTTFSPIYGMGDGCGWRMGILVDVNGDKKPNQVGKDRFTFYAGESKYCASHTGGSKRQINRLDTAGVGESREYLIERCKEDMQREQEADTGSLLDNWETGYCTAIIVNDGWEIKDDYPVKL